MAQQHARGDLWSPLHLETPSCVAELTPACHGSTSRAGEFRTRSATRRMMLRSRVLHRYADSPGRPGRVTGMEADRTKPKRRRREAKGGCCCGPDHDEHRIAPHCCYGSKGCHMCSVIKSDSWGPPFQLATSSRPIIKQPKCVQLKLRRSCKGQAKCKARHGALKQPPIKGWSTVCNVLCRVLSCVLCACHFLW